MSNANKKVKKNCLTDDSSQSSEMSSKNNMSPAAEKLFTVFLIAGITLIIAFIVFIALIFGLGHGSGDFDLTRSLAMGMGICGCLGAASFAGCTVVKKSKYMFTIGIGLLAVFCASLAATCSILISDVQNETDNAGAGILFVFLTVCSLLAGIVLTIVGGIRNRR